MDGADQYRPSARADDGMVCCLPRAMETCGDAEGQSWRAGGWEGHSWAVLMGVYAVRVQYQETLAGTLRGKGDDEGLALSGRPTAAKGLLWELLAAGWLRRRAHGRGYWYGGGRRIDSRGSGTPLSPRSGDVALSAMLRVPGESKYPAPRGTERQGG